MHVDVFVSSRDYFDALNSLHHYIADHQIESTDYHLKTRYSSSDLLVCLLLQFHHDLTCCQTVSAYCLADLAHPSLELAILVLLRTLLVADR